MTTPLFSADDERSSCIAGYRHVFGQVLFLGHDRLDVQHEVMEGAMTMRRPTLADEAQMERATRHLRFHSVIMLIVDVMGGHQVWV